MMMHRHFLIVLLFCLSVLFCSNVHGKKSPIILSQENWTLIFKDEFDGKNDDLDMLWEFQNGPSRHILSSRWRENVNVKNGILLLQAKKEKRGGQEWTAANMWTKRKFKYGYFECRYKYASASGTNNSFWIRTREPRNNKGRFEIDINEGHFPNKINMNLHNRSKKDLARKQNLKLKNHHTHKKVKNTNLSDSFHVYSLEWNKYELIWYFDGIEIRREKNTFSHREAHVWLSLAIIKWAGLINDNIDGSIMEVDYVRVYERK